MQTIEVLRAFKALGFQPKHTIRFVLFANEENGARGGAKNMQKKQKQIMKNTFLHWKVMQADLLQEVLVLL